MSRLDHDLGLPLLADQVAFDVKALGELDVYRQGPDFWRPEVLSGLKGWLLTTYDMGADWTSWERHPAGEEILIPLSGQFDMILDEATGQRTVTLCPGQVFIVPKNTWHTANVPSPGRMIFLTYGQGTDHRPRV